MLSAAGPDPMDAPSGDPAVVPRAAQHAHHRAREEGLAVRAEVSHGRRRRRNGADALRRDFAEDLGHIYELRLDGLWDRVAEVRRVGPEDLQEVGNVGRRYAEI